MKIVWDSCGGDGWPAAAMPLQQSRAYGRVLAGLGAEVRRAEITAGSGARGAAQVVARRVGPLRLSLLSRGPVWAEPPAPGEAAVALRQLARGAFPMVVTSACEAPGLRLAVARDHAILDLTGEAVALRARLSGKWRNRLVRAEAGGLAVTLARPGAASITRLLAEDAANQRLRGYRAVPAGFTLGWFAQNPGAAILAEARHRGVRVAAMLFLLHPPWASYHIGWSGEAGRRLNAHNRLLWETMLWLRHEGFTALDLGCVNRTGAPGLARFKLGTGARTLSLGATMLVPPWPCPALTRRRS